MSRRKSAKLTRRRFCEACGKVIPKRGTLIQKKLGSSVYNFDSEDCQLIFRKLVELYGKGFLKAR